MLNILKLIIYFLDPIFKTKNEKNGEGYYEVLVDLYFSKL